MKVEEQINAYILSQPVPNLWKRIGQGERERILHQVQKFERYKLGCTSGGNTIWG
jgi:hypothetical protein